MDKLASFYRLTCLWACIRIMLCYVAKACTCLWEQKQSNVNYDDFHMKVITVIWIRYLHCTYMYLHWTITAVLIKRNIKGREYLPIWKRWLRHMKKRLAYNFMTFII